MSKKSPSAGIGVGSSSILAIFVVLCLTAFATLSLVSARADAKLTQKSVDAATDYYGADCAAEQRLAELAATVSDTAPEQLSSVLTAAGYSCDNSSGRLLASYSIPIGELKTLYVQVDPLTLERLCWQVRPMDDPQEEQTPQSQPGIANLPIM